VASKIPADAMEFFRKQGAKGGKLSARARMEKLTPEQRSEVARKAVTARWAKKSEPIATKKRKPQKSTE
jgi:hypothetical protein